MKRMKQTWQQPEQDHRDRLRVIEQILCVLLMKRRNPQEKFSTLTKVLESKLYWSAPDAGSYKDQRTIKARLAHIARQMKHAATVHIPDEGPSLTEIDTIREKIEKEDI